MRTQNRPFRLTATVAVTALLVAQTVPQPVVAQAVPPPPPPRRACRTSRLAIRRHASAGWRSSTARCRSTPRTRTSGTRRRLNYPVTQGNSFWTEPNAQAAIEVSASRVAMAPGTELDSRR